MAVDDSPNGIAVAAATTISDGSTSKFDTNDAEVAAGGEGNRDFATPATDQDGLIEQANSQSESHMHLRNEEATIDQPSSSTTNHTIKSIVQDQPRARPTCIMAPATAPSTTTTRVRFRVEPTTLENPVTPTASSKPPITPTISDSSSAAAISNSKSLLRGRHAESSAAAALDSMDSIATTDSTDSLYNLAQILPTVMDNSPMTVNERAFAAATFIDSIPPYVTVRLPMDGASPGLPLSWIRNNGDRSSTSFHHQYHQHRSSIVDRQQSTPAAPNWRNLNKSASYTAASSIVPPSNIVSFAYRNYFAPSTTSATRIATSHGPLITTTTNYTRKNSAGFANASSAVRNRPQSATIHQWSSKSSQPSSSVVGPPPVASSTPHHHQRPYFGGSSNAIADISTTSTASSLQSPPFFASLKHHVQTEHVVPKHALKAKLNKYQRILDNAFGAIMAVGEQQLQQQQQQHDLHHRQHHHSLERIASGGSEAFLRSNTTILTDALIVVAKVFADAWALPNLGLDLAYGLCDYVREMNYFDSIVDLYLYDDNVRESAGLALEGCFSHTNRDYLVNHRGLLESLVITAKSVSSPTSMRVSLRIFEGLFKQNTRINSLLISLSALDFVLNACKASTDEITYRHAAFALSNLSLYSDHDCQQKMLEKNVPDWLFLLASSQDDVTRYYACLAICTLVSNKEIESAVTKSGTLSLVEPFLASQRPADIASKDHRHRQGRRREWLEKLVPMLSGKRREPRAIAAFHFAMEATIKKRQDRLDVLREIGAVEALKQAAALPDEMASKLASLTLEIIGEQCPHKLSPQVPLWTVEDVRYWVTQIGFESYALAFEENRVDGDLLLLITDEDLNNDIGITSGLYRKRFMRELDSLKMAADYGCIDETRLDRFLASVDPHFSVYTYRLLEMGVDCSILPTLCDQVLREDCGILNPVHRLKLLASLEDCKHVDDMEVALLSKRIDIFISYRRSTGNQLASLLKVLLQLRSHKVFIDVDRLYAGQFDSSLLKNIQAAKHFVLVLTPGALDRCVGDDSCSDWVHKEVRCALEYNKNVIPLLDPRFEWPDEMALPNDMRAVTRFNAVRWVHEYQEACVSKLEKFIKGEMNVNRGFYPSLPQRSKTFFPPTYNRSMSKPTSSSNNSSTDLVVDTLSVGNQRPNGHRSSNERLLAPGPEMFGTHHDTSWND